MLHEQGGSSDVVEKVRSHTIGSVRGVYNPREYAEQRVGQVKISAKVAQAHAENEFEKYRVVQDRLFESDFDRAVKKPVAGKPSTREDRQAPASGSVEVSVQAMAANGAAQLHSGRR